MVIKGCNIFLKDLSLDGTLIVDPVDDAGVVLHLCTYTITLEHSYKLIDIDWCGESCNIFKIPEQFKLSVSITLIMNTGVSKSFTD